MNKLESEKIHLLSMIFEYYHTDYELLKLIIGAKSDKELCSALKNHFVRLCRSGVLVGDIIQNNSIYNDNGIYANHSGNDVFVLAYANGYVKAGGYSLVCAFDEAEIFATDNTVVWALGNNKIRAFGYTTIWAFGECDVDAFGYACVNTDNTAKCKLNDNSVFRVFDDRKVICPDNKMMTLEYQ